MKISNIIFPSVFEASFGNTENSAKNFVNGIKIKKDENWYIVGNLAKKGGIHATRVTNASPVEDDYEILFKSAMINVLPKLEQPISLTVGFPLSTYNFYKGNAEQFYNKRYFLVESDTTTFDLNGSVKKFSFELDRYEVIPEIVGCIIGLKKLHTAPEPKNFLAISLGFGTVEGGMATEDGLINRTCFSSHGLQYAIDNLTKELNKKYYLELKNVHQVDEAFIKGSIFVNRKRVDLTTMRKNLLRQYYKQVISPLIRKYILDSDFENCEKVYLFGGGANYQDLVEIFNEELGNDIPVEVAPQPEKIASIGYLYNSYRISDKHSQRSVGIDIGNATTVVSIFQDDIHS